MDLQCALRYRYGNFTTILIIIFTLIIMFVCFAGEKNDDPNHPDYVPSQFSFLKSPVKAKMKRDLIRYHRSEKIKANH